MAGRRKRKEGMSIHTRIYDMYSVIKLQVL